MMRHHFQSHYFWDHYISGAKMENKSKKMEDLNKDSGGDEKVGNNLIPEDKLFRHKVDCLFIFIAILIVCGFTLTVSSFGNEHLNSRNFDQIYKNIMDMPEDQVNTVDENKVLSDMLPLSYVLYLYPKINKRSYMSIVKINIKCKKATSHVVFHSSVRNIHSVSLKSKDGRVHIKKKYRNRKKEMMILILNDDLKPDVTYELLITVYGLLTFDRSRSIYLIKYHDEYGKKHEMLMTNFGYTGAREVWPCFDEPAMKATWRIIVQHVDKYQAISNMPVNEVKALDTNMVETYFEVSPKISCNLVALILTEYNYKEVTSVSGVKIRAYAPPGRLSETKLALKVASLVVDYFSRKFSMKYLVNPLPKLDLVPVDINVQYKGSWGLMVLKEDIFFDNLSMDSIFLMEKLALAISKEVCHQWFGYLVTQKKWSETWLKESVCGYLQKSSLQFYYPSWNLNNLFFVSTFHPAMMYDSNKYSQSIAVAAKNTRAYYNAAKYDKPTSIVTMLANFIGSDVFLKGLHIYLNEFQFSTADPSDLWNVLSGDVSSIDVSALMSQWINQPGFPLVTCRRIKNGLLIKQKTFKFEKSVNSSDKDGNSLMWQIPISVKICGKMAEYILKTKEGIIPVNSTCDANAVYHANYGASGFYRVNYERNNWLRLLKLMKTNHKLLPAIDRANLLGNVHSLARFRHVDITLLLDFTLYLKNEHHFVPWKIASSILDEFHNVFYHTNVKNCIKEYTLKQVTPVINHLNTFKKHSHPQRKLIALLLTYAVRYQMQPIRRQMENKFLKWQVSNGKKRLGGSISNVILSAGILGKGNREWNFIFQQYKNAKSTEKQNMLLSILSSSTNRYQLRRLVNYKKNRISVLTHVCRNIKGKDIAWKVVNTNWNFFLKRYNTSVNSLRSLLTACLGSGTTEDDLSEVKKLRASLSQDASELALVIDGIIEGIEVNMQYHKYEKEIIGWFRREGFRCLN